MLHWLHLYYHKKNAEQLILRLTGFTFLYHSMC